MIRSLLGLAGVVTLVCRKSFTRLFFFRLLHFLAQLSLALLRAYPLCVALLALLFLDCVARLLASFASFALPCVACVSHLSLWLPISERRGIATVEHGRTRDDHRLARQLHARSSTTGELTNHHFRANGRFQSHRPFQSQRSF